jgi:glucose-1-phosphate thymidylyltransferase
VLPDSPRTIGVVPAAGSGSRLGPLAYPKELLPLRFDRSTDGTLQPSLAIEHSLSAIAHADVKICGVVISPSKTEIVRYLGDGTRCGVPLAYVVQPTPQGLVQAVHQVQAALGRHGDIFCLALPDTVFTPVTALARVRRYFIEAQLDLALGVFPTEVASHLGPVVIGQDGAVLRVLEKPPDPPCNNTWGIAVWAGAFSALLHDACPTRHVSVDVPLGVLFQRALELGLRVGAVSFEDGTYHDLGTVAGLARFAATTRAAM